MTAPLTAVRILMLESNLENGVTGLYVPEFDLDNTENDYFKSKE